MRTITWDDPMSGAAAARQMSGLKFLQAVVDQELPPAPIAELMGFGSVEVEEGRVMFACEPAEYHYNPIAPCMEA